MFHVPFITENIAFKSLTDRIRRTKLLIPVAILIVAYTVAILAVVFSTSKLEVTEEMRASTRPPEGAQGPSGPTTPPTACPTLPNQSPTAAPGTTRAPTVTTQPPITSAPSGPTTPSATTGAPGTTRPPTSAPTSTPSGPTTPGVPPATNPPVTVLPPATGAPTTKAPTGPTTPAPATTKAPTTAAPTTRAPTTAAPTTTPAATPAPVTTAPTGTLHPPAELGGKRGFCFRNSCSETIWVGQIGASTGIKCGAGCPKGTICNPDLDLGCYFSLPFPASKAKLEPGKFFCLAFDYDPITTNIYMPDGTVIHLEVQWSGAIFASTKCDDQLNCATGICKECTLTECHECPSYRGPVGPVTQGEMTLSGIWKDYYDTTLIHGANLPLVIKPMTYQPNFWPDQYQKPAYHCGAPGSPYTVGDSPGATWQFKRLPTQTDKQLARPLVTGGSKASCVGGKACPTGEVCGISMGLTERNQPRADIGDTVCGIPAGIWSRSELCGWTDSWAFEDCKTSPSPNSGTMQKLYKCDTPHHESCFQPNVDTKCCGCTVWPDFIPTHGEDCKNHNPVWEQTVMPHLEQIKRACPTCYTYPYDDSTALYTCWDDELWNAASYEFEWCPAKTTVAY